jgi:hypothetical protein
VIVVLADRQAATSVRDVQKAVCAILGENVPRSSVKGWLSAQESVRHHLVTRVSLGHYALILPAATAAVEQARRRMQRQ